MKSISFIFWGFFLSTHSRGYITCANVRYTCKALSSAWHGLSDTAASCVIPPQRSAGLSLSSIGSVLLRKTIHTM